MKDAIYVWTFIGLPAWWIAQALLSLRDYFRRRRELRQLPPPTREELETIAHFRADLPRKEKKPLQWYLQHPLESFTQWWWLVPVLVFFWPMAVLLWTLPSLETRLSQEAIRRLRAEGAQ